MSTFAANTTPASSNSQSELRDINIVGIKCHAPAPPKLISIACEASVATNYIFNITATAECSMKTFNYTASSDYAQPEPYTTTGTSATSKSIYYTDDTQFFRLFVGGQGSIKTMSFPDASVAFDSVVVESDLEQSATGLGSISTASSTFFTKIIKLPYFHIGYDSVSITLRDKDASKITARIPATDEYIDAINDRVGTSIKAEFVYANKSGAVKKTEYMTFTLEPPSFNSDDDYIDINGSVEQDFSGIARFLSYSSGTVNTQAVWAAKSSGIIISNPESNAKTVNMNYLGDNKSTDGKISVTYPFIEPSIRPQNRVTFGNSDRAMIVSWMSIKMDNNGTEFVLNE